MHACVWLYVYVWSGEREHKDDNNSSGWILQSAYVKKEKSFQIFHPHFLLMSNVIILWKAINGRAMYYFYGLYTELAFDLLEYSKINKKTLHAMWAVAIRFLQRCCEGFEKCWLQIADVICGCGCKMYIHRWCEQLIILLISYWEQSASLWHAPLGSLRGVARAKTFRIPQKPGSELGERKMLIDNLRPWPWGFVVSWDISYSNQVFAGLFLFC